MAKQKNDKEFLYAVRWEGADGEHLNVISLGTENHQRARDAAARLFKRVKIISVMTSTPEQIEQMRVDLLKRYESRIPIDEKTGGKPNFALVDPELLAEDK